MARSLAKLTAGVTLAVGAWSLAACLRLTDEPDAWPCDSERDCKAGEFCLVRGAPLGECRPVGFCWSSSDCGRLQVCQSYTCMDVECTETAPENCAPYRCLMNSCNETCVGDSACQQGYACKAGSCVPFSEVECSPTDPASCGGFACWEDGRCATTCTTIAGCAEGYACTGARCEPIPPDVCEPNEVFCDGEVYATCDSTGQGALPGGRDCDADGLECTVLGCGDAVGAAVSADECRATSGQSAALGNIYWLHTTVTLISFTQLLDFSTTPSVRWFVYVSDALEGPFTEVASGESETGVSPTFGIELEAGRYYLLGAESAELGPNGFCGIDPTDVFVGFGRFTEMSYHDASGMPASVSNPSSSIGAALQFVNTVILP